MSEPERVPLWRRWLASAVAAVVVLALYLAAQLPTLEPDERAALAARFAFTSLPLQRWSGDGWQTRRSVNPSLEKHSGWISAVGAAVALLDLDGDGLANDVCHVDPRTDRVTLAPAPGTGARYPLFALEPPRPGYDRRTMAPMGCVPADVDEDGRMDLLVYYWGRTPLIFMDRSKGGGPPTAAHFSAVLLTDADERWFTNALTFADLDGDGHLDVLVGNYFQDGARILDASATTRDFMQHSMSRAYNAGRNRIFRGLGGGRGDGRLFEEVEGLFDEQVDHAWTLAIGTQDLDGDLLPEIYYANDFGPDRLFHNRSTPGALEFERVEAARGFTKPRSKVLGRDSFKGMGVDFADLNGDGMMDFFVSNIADEYALEESHFVYVSQGDPSALARGKAPYEDLSEPLGVARSSWSWDTRFGDFDNDGVPEMLQATGFAKGEVDRWPELQELATGNDELLALPEVWPQFQEGDDLSGHAPNPFYVRASSGRYFDLSADLGLAAPQVTRGIATGDIDGDGDLDFVVANQWEDSILYRNDRSAERPDFIGLHLRLPAGGDGLAIARVDAGGPGGDFATRVAVGATAIVERAGQRQTLQVDGGNGHSGVRSPELHFGLAGAGAPEEPVAVEIRYRDRRGVPGTLALELEPGWHTVVLPDAPSTWARLAPPVSAEGLSGGLPR